MAWPGPAWRAAGSSCLRAPGALPPAERPMAWLRGARVCRRGAGKCARAAAHPGRAGSGPGARRARPAPLLPTLAPGRALKAAKCPSSLLPKSKKPKARDGVTFPRSQSGSCR